MVETKTRGKHSSLRKLLIALGKDCLLTDRDISDLVRRFNSEGIHFLMVELPKLDKALLLGIARNMFECPETFKRAPRSELPQIGYSLWCQVFDDEGYLRDFPPPTTVRNLRQMCAFFYKMKEKYTQEQEDDVISRFLSTEDELWAQDLSEPSLQPLLRIATEMITDLFGDFDAQSLVFKDGPGVVSNSDRVSKRTKPLASMPITGPEYLSWHFLNPSAMYDSARIWPNWHVPMDQDIAKVLLVPKDSRGPRLISAEPAENQWVQQGLFQYMANALERHPLSRGRVNFEDQGINKALACEASKFQTLSTLDLKDASDRVSLELVERLFSGLPELRKILLDSRSRRSELPDGTIIELCKFAPMGSAVCFPVLATVAFVAIRSYLLHWGYIEESHEVFVYGDDIIVPTHVANFAKEALSSFGFRVNSDKSFVGSRFCESCGGDYFDGFDVTPVRLRTLPSRPEWEAVASRERFNVISGASWIPSLVATANQLAQGGFNETAEILFSMVEDTLGTLPNGYEHSPYLCRLVFVERSREVIRHWFIKTVAERSPDETGWSHFTRTVHSLGEGIKLPDFGEYTIPKTTTLILKRPTELQRSEWPASDWLPGWVYPFLKSN